MIDSLSVNIPSFFASAREISFRCFKGLEGVGAGDPVLGGLLDVLIANGRSTSTTSIRTSVLDAVGVMMPPLAARDKFPSAY
jgi:hypothetical protein